MPEAGFAQTYRQARQLFLSAAGAAGATAWVRLAEKWLAAK